ncbi:MAG: hypothetical protein WBI40_00860 [Methylococcaceae bacterium]
MIKNNFKLLSAPTCKLAGVKHPAHIYHNQDNDVALGLFVFNRGIAMKKFAVQIHPAQQPIRVDASTIEKAREITQDFFGSIHDAYQLFDWVQSPAMLSEVNG